MESKRQQLLGDPNLYPEFFKPGQRKPSGQPPASTTKSISSSSMASSSASSTTATTVQGVVKRNKVATIVISSDEGSEDENGEINANGNPPPKTVLEQLGKGKQPTGATPPVVSRDNMKHAVERAQPRVSPQRNSVPAPVELPTNKPFPFSLNTANDDGVENFVLPDARGTYDPHMSAAEAEKEFLALVAGTVTNVEDGVEIDMKQAVVEGFTDGIMLLPHQVLGRIWMRERESGKKMGGLLADDMGLGKTIQTLTRIVDGRPKKSDKADGWAPSTLVVCPVALVSQWASEIKKMAVGLRVVEHHGPHRTSDPLKLQQAHVVITSYSIVSSEYASYAPEAKDESKKSKSKKSGKTNGDGGAGAGSDSGSSEDFTRKLKAKAKAGKTKDALFGVKWYRIVLDEAHNIKNRNTKTAVACCALQGKYRWCLTGTPMQNSVEELYSLIKFLRIRPLNDWQTFNEQIAKAVKGGYPNRAMKRLQVVLKAIMLRRTKNQILNGKPLLQLPGRKLDVVECQFDSTEKEFYTRLENRMSSEVNKLVRESENVSYTHVLVLLLRLRQACNHPSLVSKDYRTDRDAADPKPAKDDDDGVDGLDEIFGQMGVSSGKKCQLCQAALPAGQDSVHCDACASLAVTSGPKSTNLKDPSLPPDSAKIRKLLEILKEIDERSGGEEKTIIFSQFTSMLDLIGPFLDAQGVKYVRYDGTMQKDKREASLEKIKNSKSTRCILISFKAGSTGLNLTACNNVILVDMWWNPALEDQAYDRAHRLGQTRDVNIYKLMIPDTVETRILQLQDAKRQLATAALSGDKLKNMKLGMDDLLALFRGFDRDGDDD
ncbi:SNF2 family N-terminal domain-containing protein [Pisolithus marmoratus]|nr:SNF2 family N-terminal domain-containing protein [Pisolithus marmoratus]